MRVKVEMNNGREFYLDGELADDFIESALSGDDFFRYDSEKISETRYDTAPNGALISGEVPFIVESFARFDQVVSYQTLTRAYEDL